MFLSSCEWVLRGGRCTAVQGQQFADIVQGITPLTLPKDIRRDNTWYSRVLGAAQKRLTPSKWTGHHQNRAAVNVASEQATVSLLLRSMLLIIWHHLLGIESKLQVLAMYLELPRASSGPPMHAAHASIWPAAGGVYILVVLFIRWF